LLQATLFIKVVGIYNASIELFFEKSVAGKVTQMKMLSTMQTLKTFITKTKINGSKT